MVAIDIIATLLAADFVSGLFHWLEDAYGREHWPVTGWLITKPNILHHLDPRYFTRHSWFCSARLLLLAGLVVLSVAWLCDILTWQVWLFVILGVNANEVHKWAHRTRVENGPVITFLQHIRLLQTPHHHARHHRDPKSSHYCVFTDFLNPILDGIRLWERLESFVWVVLCVGRRVDASVSGVQPAASKQSARVKRAVDGFRVQESKSQANLQFELAVFALFLAVLNLPLLTGRFADSLAFLPAAVQAGEWWRVFTHPFVHVSWYHLLLDGAAFLMAYAELRERHWFERLGFVAASGAGGLLAALGGSPLVCTHGLCGLSGIAHGLTALVALEMMGRRGDRLARVLGLLCFLGILVKALIEALTGKVLLALWHSGWLGTPIAVCHAGGVLGALTIWMLFRMLKPTRADPVISISGTLVPSNDDNVASQREATHLVDSRRLSQVRLTL